MIVYFQNEYHKMLDEDESNYRLQSESGEIIFADKTKCVKIDIQHYFDDLQTTKGELEKANLDYSELIEKLPQIEEIQNRIAELKTEKTALEKDIRRIYALDPSIQLPDGYSQSQKIVWEYDEKLLLSYLARAYPEVLTINKSAFEKIVDEIPWEIAEQVRLRKIGHRSITIHK